MRAYLLLFLLLVSSVSAFSIDYTIQTVPDPKKMGAFYVSNPDSILTPSEKDAIEVMLSTLEDSTATQMAVVVVRSIGDEVPKDFAVNLFNHWGVGDKKNNNGLLLLVVLNQRRVEISTGYGMEVILPDILCKNILDKDVVPYFKEERYGEGIINGLTTIIKIIKDPNNSELIESYKESSGSYEDFEAFTYVMFVIFGIYSIFAFFIFRYKNKNNTFSHRHELATGEHKETIPIGRGRWIFIYFILPAIFVTCAYFSESIFNSIALLYVFIAIALYEKRTRSNVYHLKKHDDAYEDYTSLTKSNQDWFWTVFIFPFPFIFYWIWYKATARKLRNTPRSCKTCQKAMEKLSEKADDKHLSKTQILEEQLKSVDYDVWYCKDCSNHEVLSYVNYWSKYKDCPSCEVNAYYLHSDKTLVSPTYSSTGTGLKTHLCKSCKHKKDERYTIAKLERSSSSSSGGGGGSSSWGGGSSGGGGAGSSW